jgi:hypothetical protein
MAKPSKKLSASDPKSVQARQDQLESEWRAIGLSGPARRALVEAKLYRVSDLRKVSLAELVALKGVAKSAVARIRVIMDAKKISFRL